MKNPCVRAMTVVMVLTIFCSHGLLAAPGSEHRKPVPDQAAIEKWRADVRYMAEALPKRHKDLFHAIKPEQFESAVNRLYERIPSLTPPEIFVEMARIVAMIGDGHTKISPNDAKGVHLRQYPLRLALFRDGLFVQAAAPEYAQAVGARVVKIGGAPTDEAIRAVREIISRDNEMTIKSRTPALLVVPEVLHALGLIEQMERATFIVETHGRQIALNLKPIEPGTSGQWIDARDGATAPPPLWLKDPGNHYWFEYLADSRTVYVQYNAVQNKPEESIEAFFKRVFAFVETHPVDRFVLDIRLNGGGNGYLNRPIIHGLIRCDKINQPGKLFTIIGRRTFSAAVKLAVDLEKHTQTLFVGEPTGGSPNHYGDATKIVLPNSGLTVAASTLWWQDVDPRDTRPWIAPHIVAELSSEDYRTNMDPALKAILDYVHKPALVDVLVEAILAGHLELALKQYREFKMDSHNTYANTEQELRMVARRLARQKRYNEALEICKLNAAEHPQSYKVYHDLGEAYMHAGNEELAIKNYEKALELNPEDWSATDALKTLRGEVRST